MVGQSTGFIIYTRNLYLIHKEKSRLQSRQSELPYKQVEALNERDYGDYTGLNKWEVKAKVGDDKFNAIRRNYDEPIPE